MPAVLRFHVRLWPSMAPDVASTFVSKTSALAATELRFERGLVSHILKIAQACFTLTLFQANAGSCWLFLVVTTAQSNAFLPPFLCCISGYRTEMAERAGKKPSVIRFYQNSAHAGSLFFQQFFIALPLT